MAAANLHWGVEERPPLTLGAFEALEFEVDSFGHEAHVYVAWWYLQAHDLLVAIERFRATLIRLTSALGIPGKYHETITWFYLIAVAEASVGLAKQDWALFKQQNPALFRRNPSIIQDYYSEARLMSDAARSTFLLPDLVAAN